MSPRPVLGALLVLCLCTGCIGNPLAGQPKVTLENQVDASYSVDIYTVRADDPDELDFIATTGTGDRKQVPFQRIFWAQDVSNVTLPEHEPATYARTVSLPAQEERTFTLEEWSKGEGTLYVISNQNGTVYHTYWETCRDTGQSHTLTIQLNSFRTASSCAGGWP